MFIVNFAALSFLASNSAAVSLSAISLVPKTKQRTQRAGGHVDPYVPNATGNSEHYIFQLIVPIQTRIRNATSQDFNCFRCNHNGIGEFNISCSSFLSNRKSWNSVAYRVNFQIQIAEKLHTATCMLELFPHVCWG